MAATLTAVITLALVLRASPAPAQDLRIGFVDLQKAIQSTQEWKREFSSFKQNFKKEKNVIAAKEKRLKSMLEALNKQGFILDPDLKEKKEAEFRKKKKQFERYVKDKNEEFARKEKAITQDILEKMVKVIKKIGREKRYSVILEKKIGLYFDKQHDLTDLAVRTYDKMR